MSPALLECENQALQLTPTERAVLAEHLIASLDRLSDAQNEQLWFEEAERRYQAYKAGGISARSAEDVLSGARAAIQ